MRFKKNTGAGLAVLLSAAICMLFTNQATANGADCECAATGSACRASVIRHGQDMIVIVDTYRCARITLDDGYSSFDTLIEDGRGPVLHEFKNGDPRLSIESCDICVSSARKRGGVMMSGVELTNVTQNCKAASGYRMELDKVYSDEEAGKVIAHLSSAGRDNAAKYAYEAVLHKVNYAASEQEIDDTHQPHRRRSLEDDAIYNDVASDESVIKAKYMRCMLYQLGL